MLTVYEVQPGRAEIDWGPALVAGVVDRLAELDQFVVVLGPIAASIQPKLPIAVRL